jgi:hypothetical protein
MSLTVLAKADNEGIHAVVRVHAGFRLDVSTGGDVTARELILMAALETASSDLGA